MTNSFTNLLTNARTDSVETDDRSIFNAHELDEALSIQDIRLSVARKVVFDGSHRITVLLTRLLFGQTNRSDFGLAEGNARNSGPNGAGVIPAISSATKIPGRKPR